MTDRSIMSGLLHWVLKDSATKPPRSPHADGDFFGPLSDCVSSRSSANSQVRANAQGAFGRGQRDAEDSGGFGHAQTREEPEFHQLGPLRIELGQPVDGFVKGEQIVVRRRLGQGASLVQQNDPVPVPAMLGPTLPTGPLDQVRRIASAAAPKKWPRLFQSLATSESTRRT